MIAKDPALAELVRIEQDHGKQINALLATLNNTLSMPAAERDETGIRAINATLVQLRADRKKARDDINRRFPAYADLVDPKPPTVDQIVAALRPDEAFLSFYFGRDVSFVWAVPKSGPVAFAAVPATATELEAKVRRLREALDPQAAMISDIPAFDVALGYELYALLLKPVEARLEIGEESCRGHQRRARPAAFVAAADRARRGGSARDQRLPAIPRCRGWHGLMP